MMKKVYAFLADGLEEVECLAVADVLMRGGIEVSLVSVTRSLEVTGSHGITIKADKLFEEICPEEADVLFLPGGMPGTRNLQEHRGLRAALKAAVAEGRRVAAICAAPSVLGSLGLLTGRRATCYPGFEDKLEGASYTHDGVVTDGPVTTGRGLGYALDLGLELLRILADESTSAQIKSAIQYDQC